MKTIYVKGVEGLLFEGQIRGRTNNHKFKLISRDNRLVPAYRGITVCKIKDHGNGIILKYKDKKIDLAYDEAEEIMLALLCHQTLADPYHDKYQLMLDTDDLIMV